MKENESLFQQFLHSVSETFQVWQKECIRVFKDQGVLIFFILVPLLYPLLYAFIYTGEVVHEVPVVAVDQSRSNISRHFLRHADASADLDIIAYASDMEEAKLIMKKQKAYGIILIPEDFSKRVNTGKQATIAAYCDMSGLLYYKAILSVCTDVSLEMNKDIQIKKLGNTTNEQDEISTSPIEYEYIPLYNPQNGFASFLIPAVLMLIIQQTLLLGVGQINGTAREMNTFHLQLLPGTRNGILRLVLGKTLCYFMVYAVMGTWLILAVPRLFSLPQIPQIWHLMGFMIPYLLACIFFSMTLSILVTSREACMPLFVFGSIPLLFLSGISWPSSAIPEFWKVISWIFPSTFGINGFVRINSMGALLEDVKTEYIALWIQTGIYFCTACLTFYYLIRESRKVSLEQKKSETITDYKNNKDIKNETGNRNIINQV